MNKWILLVSLLFAMVSNAGQLDVSVGPQSATAIPVAISSCQNRNHPADLRAPTFVFNKLILKWSGTETFTPSYIQVDLKGAALTGGKYQCILSGTELDWVLYYRNVMKDGDVIQSPCGIRCGSLNVDSGYDNATIEGTVKVIGVQVDGQGEEALVKVVHPISVQYTKP